MMDKIALILRRLPWWGWLLLVPLILALVFLLGLEVHRARGLARLAASEAEIRAGGGPVTYADWRGDAPQWSNELMMAWQAIEQPPSHPRDSEAVSEALSDSDFVAGLLLGDADHRHEAEQLLVHLSLLEERLAQLPVMPPWRQRLPITDVDNTPIDQLHNTADFSACRLALQTLTLRDLLQPESQAFDRAQRFCAALGNDDNDDNAANFFNSIVCRSQLDEIRLYRAWRGLDPGISPKIHDPYSRAAATYDYDRIITSIFILNHPEAIHNELQHPISLLYSRWLAPGDLAAIQSHYWEYRLWLSGSGPYPGPRQNPSVVEAWRQPFHYMITMNSAEVAINSVTFDAHQRIDEVCISLLRALRSGQLLADAVRDPAVASLLDCGPRRHRLIIDQPGPQRLRVSTDSSTVSPEGIPELRWHPPPLAPHLPGPVMATATHPVPARSATAREIYLPPWALAAALPGVGAPQE